MQPQKPFSWDTPDREFKLPIVPTPLSKNTKGICYRCGFRVQKVKPQMLCNKCHKSGYTSFLKVLPSELFPWQIKAGVRTKAFECKACMEYFFSYALMGTLCTHKKHQPPHYTCRICCRKVTISDDTQTPVPENIQNQPNSYEQDVINRTIQQTGRAIRSNLGTTSRNPPIELNELFTHWTLPAPVINQAISQQPLPGRLNDFDYEFYDDDDGDVF